MDAAASLIAPPRFVTDEQGQPVEAILGIEDYNLFLEMLEDANLSRLLTERRREPSRPLSACLGELDGKARDR